MFASPRLTIGAAVRIAGTWTRSAGQKHIQDYELQANKVDVLGPSDASVCSLCRTA
jgi:asparaginyl-tRNA synthetase